MTDGIFDLLSAILVLGIVVAIAFGFIMPLTNDDVMQNNAKLEDKAMVGEIVKYDDPTTYSRVQRRKYSYDEFILLMSVQDNKMGGPKGINIRNMVTGHKLWYWGDPVLENENYTETVNFNDDDSIENRPNDKIFQAIKYYSENGTDLVYGSYEKDKDNIGTIRFTEDFPLRVDELCRFLASDSQYRYTNKNNPIFYIDYQYAVPDDNPYNNIERNYDETPIYMVHIDGSLPTSVSVTSEIFNKLMCGIVLESKAGEYFVKNGYGTIDEYNNRYENIWIDTGIINDTYYRYVSRNMN